MPAGAVGPADVLGWVVAAGAFTAERCFPHKIARHKSEHLPQQGASCTALYYCCSVLCCV
jgi:hypothetical protein